MKKSVVAYKNSCDVKLLRIIFDKVDEYIRKYDKSKYLTLFQSKIFGRIFGKT